LIYIVLRTASKGQGKILMADDTHEPIGGTIIQRSFVAHGIAHVVNIATVPVSEAIRDLRQIEEDGALRFLTAEILGIPAETVPDERQYRNQRWHWLGHDSYIVRDYRGWWPPHTAGRIAV
jgi:hypothetical protein